MAITGRKCNSKRKRSGDKKRWGENESQKRNDPVAKKKMGRK